MSESLKKNKVDYHHGLKKVGKNTRPFTYDYIVEVTNRFKGLDLIDRVPEKLGTEVHDIVWEAVIKTIPKKKKYKKADGRLRRA